MSELPPPPTEPAARKVWAALSQPYIGPQLMKLISRDAETWHIKHGPTASDPLPIRLFLMQSMFYQVLSRQSAWVLDQLTAEEVDAAWQKTLDGKWQEGIELITGPTEMRRYAPALPKAYGICLALDDPYDLREGLERLASEVYQLPPFKAKRRLVNQLKKLITTLPERTLRRYAFEAGLKKVI